MLQSPLLFLGDIGGTEVMLISMLSVLLFILVLWRIFRPSKPVVVQHQSTSSVADELLKLQALRKEGALTEQEFEAQKQRLMRG
ncbi:SHOCT domain-containing protein [Hymenobacter sp. BT188]|uniref:SHOCT domain-containing protein n=1 Tax=Hymenobacter sp. BT188 TaxID=2763504 RepID=UPI0016513836|nr:SHOCT domain-containing protein [Hymenobacter sp. BT188]MBC6606961.1 SHOCT domain-containing protein [Hymenobacter sp. BT188]